ncbi:hypothetical protein LTR37_013921, partial [Vermiconidia calcicola]
ISGLERKTVGEMTLAVIEELNSNPCTSHNASLDELIDRAREALQPLDNYAHHPEILDQPGLYDAIAQADAEFSSWNEGDDPPPRAQTITELEGCTSDWQYDNWSATDHSLRDYGYPVPMSWDTTDELVFGLFDDNCEHFYMTADELAATPLEQDISWTWHDQLPGPT